MIIGGFLGFIIYATASGIAYKNETTNSAWDYWEKMKGNNWAELSEEERKKLITAYMIIADDVGMVITEGKVMEILEEQLPVKEQHIGLKHVIRE